MISFTVYGIPIPQGSTRAFIPKGWKRPIITAANKKTKPWRQEIAGMARNALLKQQGQVFPYFREQAIRIEADFYFQKPKSAKKSIIKKTTKPDLDKLARSVLDALTSIVFEDDSQVVYLHVRKLFGYPARADIRISEEV